VPAPRPFVIGGALAAVVVIAAALAWRLGGSEDDVASQPVTTTPTSAPEPAPTTTATTIPLAMRPQPVPDLPTTRDPLRWPFTADSIWNLPLGRDAKRVPAGLAMPAEGITADEDIVILEPTAPPVDIVAHDASWDPSLNRCTRLTGNVLYPGVPIPPAFVTDPGFLGATPNHAAAVLLADGDTIIQTQPFHRCQAGGLAVSQYRYAQDSLRTGNGIAGAHGGSQLSSLGGTIRLGELVPGGAINHALKVNVDCHASCSYDAGDPDGKPGYRWPALSADFGAAERYRGTVAALQMGALLALPADFAVDALRTEPARMMARALRDHGAYVVDDTQYPVFAFTTEWGPAGRVLDEFEQAWGFPFHAAAKPGCTDEGPACAWIGDLGTVLAALQIIDDNGPGAVGGAGARVAACAPPFAGTPKVVPAGCPAS